MDNQPVTKKERRLEASWLTLHLASRCSANRPSGVGRVHTGAAGVEGHGVDGLLRIPLNFLPPKCQTVPLIQTQGHVTLSVSQQWGEKKPVNVKAVNCSF